MAKTKDAVLTPGQKELMEKEYLDFVKPSTYGNKANPSSCNSLYDDVENPELRAIVEKVAATTPYREETSPNEAQSPPNPLMRFCGFDGDRASFVCSSSIQEVVAATFSVTTSKSEFSTSSKKELCSWA